MATLVARWEAASRKFIELAEAIPEDKAETELISNTRSYMGVLRHVGYWNCYVADSLHGRKAHDSGNELSRDDYPDRTQVLRELERSSKDIRDGIGLNSNDNWLDLVLMGLEHLNEHYGQLAVYARLLGIIPPASRS